VVKPPAVHHLRHHAEGRLVTIRNLKLLDRAKRTTLTPQAYRDAMSHFAGAVTIVTTDGPAGRRGVTVSAAISVSDNPPTVAVCLNRNRDENRWFADNGCFAINVLLENQIELARAFAGEGHLDMSARFDLGKWKRLATGAPILGGARTALDCIVRDVNLVHTHYVIMGEVMGIAEPAQGLALAYLDRDYRPIRGNP
jgi:flavin reductase (DIM6/NTAB) family NADH-FMN oxidoreductase RutF